MSLDIKEKNNYLVFNLKIVPGSSRDCIAEILDGALKIKISAPPEKGKANKAVIAFLSKKLGINKNDIDIVSGLTIPTKTVRVKNIDREELVEKLIIDNL
ncbi:MAG: DUF167 domain-containing protein [Phycisphaerae bacterium]|nr:DUF167 domain-containing protein [Phycisphaerae bacterium]